MLENFSIFFNDAEFAVTATIRGRSIAGLKGSGTLTLNDVETQKTTFTCASQAISGIQHGERLLLSDQTYAVVGVQPDGTGLTRLILERI